MKKIDIKKLILGKISTKFVQKHAQIRCGNVTPYSKIKFSALNRHISSTNPLVQVQKQWEEVYQYEMDL